MNGLKLVIDWPGRAPETLEWPTNFTIGEMRLIKYVTHLRPSEIDDAIEADDPDIVVAYTAVALQRAHPDYSYKQISRDLDALQSGSITIDATALADDPGGQIPPAEDEPEKDDAPPA